MPTKSQRRPVNETLIPGLDLPVVDRLDATSEPSAHSPDAWASQVRSLLASRSARAAEVADEGLRAWPVDPELLMLSALTALAMDQPERALARLKRFGKRYVTTKAIILLTALALAQQKQFTRAWTLLSESHLTTNAAALAWFVGDDVMRGWLFEWLNKIRADAQRAERLPKRTPKPVRVPPTRPSATRAPAAAVRPAAAPAPILPVIADLPKLEARFNVEFELANPNAIVFDGNGFDPMAFHLRGELVHLGLFEGFDELLCVPALQGVEAHWYQIETVRKVLKQYRGRVLLADEVGLGKTIEAGMVLKEYILRGMAERILILTPASLVGQWRDEMEAKFGVSFATSHDPLLRSDPRAFWAQPMVIASIASARRKEQAEILAGLQYDVVVVDEAHHLRDHTSASHQLVNRLQKRFLLLLSATPVQNNLLELYNLLTLLQPGIFKTQKDFRSAYMVPGKPREPANRDNLRRLMRSVMVRNTRALAAVRMPRRNASTLRAVPDAAEAACYADLTALVREAATTGEGTHRMSLQHLLVAAGSSPAAAAAAIARYAERHPHDKRWAGLLERARALGPGAKETALLKLLAQNPAEKKLVFVHQRESLTQLAERLRRAKIRFAQFSGDMTRPAERCLGGRIP